MIKPAIKIKSISILDKDVPFKDHSSAEISFTKFSFNWQSVSEANKKKERTQLPVVFQFKDGLSLTLPLQAKFYRAEDTQHVTWGTPLNQIDLEVNVNASSKQIEIAKETYRWSLTGWSYLRFSI